MKTGDLLQLGALAVVGYLVFEKYAKGSPSSAPNAPTRAPLQPSQPPYTIPPDFGVTNPDVWQTDPVIRAASGSFWDTLWEGL